MLKKLIFSLLWAVPFVMQAQEYAYTYSFFTNSPMQNSYFFSHVANDSKSFVANENGQLPISEDIFHSPGNALRLKYLNAPDGKWSASVFHNLLRGRDHFKKNEMLSFWVFQPDLSAEVSDLPQIQLMLSDSSLSASATFDLKTVNQWTHIVIPIQRFALSNEAKTMDIIAVVFSQQSNSNSEHLLYLDDIFLMPTQTEKKTLPQPKLISAQGYPMHVDLLWEPQNDENIHLIQIYRSENGTDFKAVGVQQPYLHRYADFVGQAGKKFQYKITFLDINFNESEPSDIIQAQTRAMTDEELLTMVQEASFRFYWDEAEKSSGLAKENLHGRHNMIATGASGFGIMALIVGTERHFISRSEAVERFKKILTFLEKADTFHGAYPHFLDGPTGKTVPFFGNRDNGADLVETSFLMQGLLAARSYFSAENADEKLIRDKITHLWEKVEWSWFKQFPDSKFLYWHWSPDQEWVINHNLIGWNETMVTYLLAIASPTYAIPAEMYYSGWANLDSTGYNYRSAWSNTTDGANYVNGNTYFDIKLDVGVSNGGPLFFTHYSYMGYDPHQINDKYTNYFVNNQNIARINHRYCIENPNKYKGYGDDAWGLTASDGPFHYSADEPVVWQDHGKIAPTGAIASFPYTPDESMKALKNYYFNYGKFLWGEYGFKDAFDLNQNWCSEIYMGLNQAPMTVMIENHRSGLIWKLFMKNPEILSGLQNIENLK